MGVRSFNLGQDCTIDIVSSDNRTFTFSTLGADLMSFDADPEDNLVTIKPISSGGYERRRIERTAWKGTIVVARVNSDFETLEIQQAENYHQGLDDLSFTIHQTVSNKDGSSTISEYQFTNSALWMSKGPNYRMGEAATLSLEFKADDCVQIQ